jgi:ketosteroid isomerase-like protein
MKTTTTVLTLSLGISILLSAAQAKATTRTGDPVRDDIAKVNLQYGQAFATGDSSLFLGAYASDACILAPNAPQLCGSDALLHVYKFIRKTGVRNITFTTIDLFGQTKDYVTEQGAYEMFDADAHSLGKGKYLVIWKKTTDGWRMFRDMFNSNEPPKAAN